MSKADACRWRFNFHATRTAHTSLLVVGVLMCFGHAAANCEEPFEPERLEREVLVANCTDPLQVAILADGSLLFIERAGAVRCWDAAARATRTLGQLPVAVHGEVGLLGLATDLSFATNSWIYLFFCPQETPDVMRLARFTLTRDEGTGSLTGIDLGSQAVLLEYPIDTRGAIHMGGGLCRDSQGLLYLGTGDNCPPIPELPVDQRPGQTLADAFATSSNTADLRGKILRIRPEPDGSISMPAGNLFPGGDGGRPEIYGMGCRNPFRLSVDEATGDVWWGDVGPNIQPELGIGPNGYDEVHRAQGPGHFGWPLCVGPNEPYRSFDFAARRPGDVFQLDPPENRSPNNTGSRVLPEPQPAVIWYPSGVSDRFAMLGSGGRSAMAGPVYRAAAYAASPTRLHARFDGRLFFYDWTRNWIMTVSLDQAGNVAEIEPFMPEVAFRKPIDLKIGPEGGAYLVEYGDTWGNNTDATISRIVYRRGNRPPRPRLQLSTTAGVAPLEVRGDASASVDPDADTLRYRWLVNGQLVAETPVANFQVSFPHPGRQRVEVVAIDAAGLAASDTAEVVVGNARPEVRFLEPLHGSFVEDGETVRYRLAVTDLEDGSTAAGSIAAGRVLLTREQRLRRPRQEGMSGSEDVAEDPVHPGLAMMRKTTCFSCHSANVASAGPPYASVGRRYAGDLGAAVRLAEKVVRGGVGAWGSKPMPPHPQHTLEEARLMVDWVLSLAGDASAAPVPGDHGFFRVASSPSADPRRPGPGVLVMTAEYTDDGAASLPDEPPLRGEAHCVLHYRDTAAVACDRRHGAERVEVFEREAGPVMRLAAGDWIAFDDMRLDDIGQVVWRAAASGCRGVLSLRLDAADGDEIARVAIDAEDDLVGDAYQTRITPIPRIPGLHSLYVVADEVEAVGEGEAGRSAVPPKPLSLARMRFEDHPEAAARKAADEQARTKILLVPTALDHPYATHMYTQVCRLIAACLNQTPGVEAIVSPDLDWPEDPALLEGVDALVFYSRPAGDIVLSAAHREAFLKLMKEGVGFTAIHWSTAAEEPVGPLYEKLLGGWFNFAFCGLKVDKRPLVQKLPEHPICHGWRGYDLRDEFYLNLKFDPRAVPVLTVDVDDTEQTVAWVLERDDGGRSFGTTLGHFHDNYAIPEFRRAIVNGILWTAGVDVPQAGAAVELTADDLALPPAPRGDVKQWTTDDILPLARRFNRRFDVARGRQLFEEASCVACHHIGGGAPSSGKLGPDLSSVRVAYAAYDDPRGELLRSLVEPSHRIDDRYRMQLLTLADGRALSGLVVAEDADSLTIAANPADPDQLTVLASDEIDARSVSDVSAMPSGLLNRFTLDEIAEIAAYVEAGGNPAYALYQEAADEAPLTAWADERLPVRNGLAMWLDAARINAAREASGRVALTTGMPLGDWPDASGRGVAMRQRRQEAQPVFIAGGEVEGAAVSRVAFDGVDDLLTAAGLGITTTGYTAVLVVAPYDNLGWPGLLSANASRANDYQSGFNIDLMSQATPDFQSVMVEGPGAAGILNLMREQHPFGTPQIVTVVSRPGQGGVHLRINGRPQASRDRPAEAMVIDELAVAARHWSNDPAVPPFNRGYAHGEFSDVLLYTRPLDEGELIATEVFLWEARRAWLEATGAPKPD